MLVLMMMAFTCTKHWFIKRNEHQLKPALIAVLMITHFIKHAMCCDFTVLLFVIKCLISLSELRNFHGFEHKDLLDKTFGVAVRVMGPKVVLDIVPLQTASCA